MNILIKVFKMPFIIVSVLFIGILIFGATAFLDLFNIAKRVFKPTKE
jgi:hypothetical protein